MGRSPFLIASCSCSESAGRFAMVCECVRLCFGVSCGRRKKVGAGICPAKCFLRRLIDRRIGPRYDAPLSQVPTGAVACISGAKRCATPSPIAARTSQVNTTEAAPIYRVSPLKSHRIVRGAESPRKKKTHCQLAFTVSTRASALSAQINNRGDAETY